jgi:hypothetical protein
VDTTTRFNAFLQLKGDADPGGRFLIDQTEPHVQAQYHYNVDSARRPWQLHRRRRAHGRGAVARGMRAAAMMKPFPQQQFPGSSGIVDRALAGQTLPRGMISPFTMPRCTVC